MSVEKALREELESVTGLANKVYGMYAPELTQAPYAVFWSNVGVNDKTLTGYLSSSTVNVELNLFGKTPAELKTITSEVIQNLRSFSGRAIGLDATVLVKEVILDPPVPLYDERVQLPRMDIDLKIYV